MAAEIALPTLPVVIVTALIGYIIGALWYSPLLFGKQWMKLTGKTDADVEAFYNNNIASFDTEEQVKLAYVMLSIDDLKSRVSVDDDEVRSYYENNLAGYQTEEERRVSHILIEFGDDTEAARAKAEALLAEIKAGADFATLAETSSEDTFSAEAGGDLDYITQDAMDPAFDEAAFAIENVGEVSDVVESEFGFHIIKLTDIKPSTTTAFEDVKSDIRESLLLDKATEAYFEDQNLMAPSFRSKP